MHAYHHPSQHGTVDAGRHPPHPQQLRTDPWHPFRTGLKTTAQRGVQGVAKVGRHRQPNGNDKKIWMGWYQMPGVHDVFPVSGFQFGVATGTHDEPPVLQRHLPVFQQIVNDGQHIAFLSCGWW